MWAGLKCPGLGGMLCGKDRCQVAERSQPPPAQAWPGGRKTVSRGSETDIKCACGSTFKAWVWQSANVTLMPELRQAILAGTMNVVTCPSCGDRFYVEVPFLYNDIARREWIWVYPAGYSAQAGDVAAEVEAMWERIGSTMPPEVRQTIETSYKTMVLFGMDALVRHLLSQDPGGRAEAEQ
jgi:hypothetical protein